MWWHKSIATVLGLGYAPKAPGTFGALGAVLFLAIFKCLGQPISELYLIPVIIIVTLIGTYSTHKVIPLWGNDPSKVVVDEFVGCLIAILFLPHSWIHIGLAFGLFRFFDILKPLGVRTLDTKLKGAWGVMLDDVLAGIYACLTLHLIHYFFLA
ncbi:MAG: phosphatidylglycerophosphatase A [Saprospiraceae bacterium]|nr:phosphatidylglycerophosphatase A [Saprospiraceae bacterium]